MTPIVNFSIDGNPLGQLAQRVLSGSITESDGEAADELRIKVSNYDGQLQKPRLGVVVAVSYGWQETGVVKSGQFTVLETVKNGPLATFDVTGHSADLLKTLKQQKNSVLDQRQDARRRAESGRAGQRALAGDRPEPLSSPDR